MKSIISVAVTAALFGLAACSQMHRNDAGSGGTASPSRAGVTGGTDQCAGMAGVERQRCINSSTAERRGDTGATGMSGGPEGSSSAAKSGAGQ